MTYEQHVAALRDKSERLRALLEDPHYGLASWTSAVGDALDAIAEHAPRYRKTDPPRPSGEELRALAETATRNVKKGRAITVAELVGILDRLPPDALVGCSTAADCSWTHVYGLQWCDEDGVRLQGY